MAACTSKTPEALKTILSLMHSADKDSVRLAAATYIIERAYGKAIQPSEHTMSPLKDTPTGHSVQAEEAIDWSLLSVEELELLHRLFKKARRTGQKVVREHTC